MHRRVRTAAIALLTLAALSAEMFAQEPSTMDQGKRIRRDLAQMILSLESPVTGIVEGTIYNLVTYRKMHPQVDYTKVLDQLGDIERHTESTAIAYKAYLCKMYFRNADEIDITLLSGETAPQHTFRQIADQLNTRLLVTNERTAQ